MELTESGRALLDDARNIIALTEQAVEQRHPQFLFQHADLLGQRRLADAQPRRGLGQVGFLGHGHEVAQQA
ncbi:hypothetical protein D3C78_1836780 [compost metagenome]